MTRTGIPILGTKIFSKADNVPLDHICVGSGRTIPCRSASCVDRVCWFRSLLREGFAAGLERVSRLIVKTVRDVRNQFLNGWKFVNHVKSKRKFKELLAT